jgi:hypothetical protein
VKRFLLLAVATSLLATLAVMPSGAEPSVTITVQSTYAGLCGVEPGPAEFGIPGIWGQSLINNQSGAASSKVPLDLWKPDGITPLNKNSGACTYKADALWSATVNVRGTATCTVPPNTSGCRGLHYPGVGPPVQPGRFLNFARNSGVDPKNFCRFVSTASPNQGECSTLAVGYTFAVGPPGSATELEGSYCGTSRGFAWALSGLGTTMSAPNVWSVIEWIPTSAGSLLPLSGVITGADWQPNGNYAGWSGNAGKPNMAMSGTKNAFGLTTARSYIAQVDSEVNTPGSCGGNLDLGGVQFFNQSVAIALGS